MLPVAMFPVAMLPVAMLPVAMLPVAILALALPLAAALAPQHPFAASTPVWFAPDFLVPPPPLVAVYYPDWTAAQLPPEQLDFARIDWVDFAFAVPDPATYTPRFLQSDSDTLLRRLVAAAHARGKHVKLSIGGWTGSGHFSDAVGPQNRLSFAQDILRLFHQFDLDGIDIDWEYPAEQGAPGNTYAPDDSANFLAFLRVLRSLLPPDAHITAATQVWPFAGPTGEHMRDVSAFAEVLDWVLLMNYDVWSSSPTPGPNAPLADACRNSSQPAANAHAAVARWTAAGFPARQLLLGLPAYGYVSRSAAARLRTRAAPPPPGAPNVTVTSEDGSAAAGQVAFRALLAQGALARNAPAAAPAFVGAGGFERRWDACSSTPFLRSAAAGQVVAYDDPESLALKAAFARAAGVRGVGVWDAHGDTPQGDLVRAVRRGLALPA